MTSTSIFRSFTELSVFVVSLTTHSAMAGILGHEGPLSRDATGNWKEYRTNDEEALLSDAGDDKSCVKRLPANLRQLFFEHFRYYVDHSKTKVGETEIARFAKVLGMAPLESSGATAAITDMSGTGSRTTLRHFFSTDNPGRGGSSVMTSSIDSLEKLLAMTKETRTVNGKSVSKTMKWNEETNFGLLQMSANRLYLDFGSDQDAVAKESLTSMKALYVSHPEEVISRCGTAKMFAESAEDIRAAFDQLQSCEVGYKTKAEVQCFGRWATLCPNYNITLALVAPKAYFATHRATPLCAKTFRKILKTGRADGGITPVKIPVGPVKIPVSPVKTPVIVVPLKPTSIPEPRFFGVR